MGLEGFRDKALCDFIGITSQLQLLALLQHPSFTVAFLATHNVITS
jgi:hypothetical protein